MDGMEQCVCHGPKDHRECPICMGTIAIRDSISLDCDVRRKHAFHKECLTKWLQQDKESCPSCREHIPYNVILTLDPTHFVRKTRSLLVPQTIELNVPGIARFMIPRPMGTDARDVLMRVAIAATEALSALDA